MTITRSNVARHPDTVIIEASGTYGSPFDEIWASGGIYLPGADEITVAYAYGISREDIYCLACAVRKNGLSRAMPIGIDTLNAIAGDVELECAFCEAVI